MSKDYRFVSDTLLNDPDLVQIFLCVSSEGFEGLDDIEAMRAQLIYQSTLRFWQDAHFQYAKESLHSELWVSIERGLSSSVATKGFKQYWRSRQNWYSQDFARYPDTQTSSTPFRSVQEEISHRKALDTLQPPKEAFCSS